MILVSTGGYKDKTALEVVNYFFEHEILEIELSGGQFSDNTLQDLNKFKNTVSFCVHNYFPPPKIPFVLNLASMNNEIFIKSFEHMKASILLAKSLGSSFYSFHAGFLIDPKVNELGKRIISKKMNSRLYAKEIFIERVNQLADFAYQEGVSLLIENNVLSYKNLIEFKGNPLLMADPDETAEIMQEINSNVGLLVDVAHLKVSSNSLKFNPEIFFTKCERWIRGYHLSDNDGLSDSNSPFTEEAWFWPHLKKDIQYRSIEVYNVTPKTLKELKNLTAIKLGS